MTGDLRIDPLFRIAVVQGLRPVIEAHLKRGVDINARDERGQTALMMAAAKGHAVACKLLLQAGADPTLKDTQGKDACFHATQCRKSDIYILIAEALERWEARAKAELDTTNALQAATGAVQDVQRATEHTATSSLMSVTIEAAQKPTDWAFDTESPGTGWEVVSEPMRPEQDVGALRAAARLSLDASLHLIEASGADWDAATLDLPSVASLARAGGERVLDPTLRRRIGRLVLVGLRQGRLPADSIDAVAKLCGALAPRLAPVLATAITDLGIVVDDDRDIARGGQGWAERANQAEAFAIGEALTAIESALRVEDDDLGRFSAEIRRWELLTREDEAVYGGRVQNGLNDALSIMARSSVLLGHLMETGLAILRGARPISVLSDGFTGTAADVTEGPEDVTEAVPVDQDDALPTGSESHTGSDVPPLFVERFHAVTSLHNRMINEGGVGSDPTLSRSMIKALKLLDLSSTYIEELLRLAADSPRETRLLQEFNAAIRRFRQVRDRMVMSNMRLVVWCAKKYRNRGLDLDDLVQEGAIGLMRAAEKYDPARGFKFATYAVWWIRQGISRAIADRSRTIRLPVHFFEKVSKLKRISRLGVNVEALTVEHVSTELEVDLRTARRLLQAVDDVVPIDEIESTETLPEAVTGVESWSADPVYASELRSAIQEQLRMLHPRVATVLRLRFGLFDDRDLTLEEIGNMYGVTRERVRQIEAKGLRMLKNPGRSKRLRGFV
ncbi:MAG: hypothetical protein RLY86_2567 [Pseudomonadota bacterium]